MNNLERIKYLVELINKLNIEYYELDSPSVSDYEYDLLYKELVNLEKEFPELVLENSPTKKVGSLNQTELKKVIHNIPMLSLSNAMNIEELKEFDQKLLEKASNFSYICELKIDGIASTLHYKDGLFIKGATRGDGVSGEDITMNLKQIDDCKYKLTDNVDIEVRGEVYMKKSVLEYLNEERLKLDLEPFKNPRNACGGSLRQLDYNITKERKLNTFFYIITEPEKLNLTSQYEVLKYLEKLGLSVNPNYRLCKNIDEVIKYINDFENLRKEFDYETDGVVIKVNEFRVQEELGFTQKAPKWAIAFKYPPVEVETKLKNILFTVGRTGCITPNAILEPVEVSGSIVSKATLNNVDFIKNKDIRVNDYVIIRKAGEIIPEVVRVNLEKRTNETPFEMISNCPICSSSLIRKDAFYYCVNENCDGINYSKLVYFASKSGMNIETLGEEVMYKFYTLNLVRNIYDIYKLENHYEYLISLDGFGKKSVEVLLNNINESKLRPLNQVITSLGIKLVGSKVSKLLTKHFNSLDALKNATIEQLENIKDIGKLTAISIVNYFKDNYDIVNKLQEVGINPVEINNNTSDVLKGLTFVVTGKLEKYTRDEVTLLIEQCGGSVSNSVSKKTSYLLNGVDGGSKLTKALSLNVKVINEEEFENMIK